MNFADAGDGIGLRVVGSQRTADYLCGDGDTLAQGQQYVTVSIELTCDPARSENCVIASFDFELAGANGIIYPNTAEEDDSAFDIPPGSEAFGDVSAFISGDDTNIILLFYHFPTIPYTFPLVFATGLEEVTRVKPCALMRAASFRLPDPSAFPINAEAPVPNPLARPMMMK